MPIEPGNGREWGLIVFGASVVCAPGGRQKRSPAVTVSIWSQFPGTRRQECCCLSQINNSKVKMEGIQIDIRVLLSLSPSLNPFCVYLCVCVMCVFCVCACVITREQITGQFIKLLSALLRRIWVSEGNTACLSLMTHSESCRVKGQMLAGGGKDQVSFKHFPFTFPTGNNREHFGYTFSPRPLPPLKF